MIVYTEKKLDNQSIFTKVILGEDGSEISSRSVYVPMFKIEKDSFVYFVLYSSKMEVISDAYEYLNFTLANNPITTRSKTAYALRLLYCFLELSNIDIKSIDEQELKEIQLFFKGLGSISEKYSLITQRTANTINGYMAAYRSYFSNRKIQCDALFRSQSTIIETTIGNDYSSNTERKKYSNNLKTGGPSGYIPKYLSPDDFRKLYRLTIEKNDKTSKIIMHLMYGYGLRLGEVLGLTIEDISEITFDGKLVPIIYLRNRITDKPFQFSKGLPHVSRPQQYKRKDYKSQTSQIIITYSLYEEIIDFINSSHQKANESYSDNYKSSIADFVSNQNSTETNHYIFLNRYGRVLSDQTWNNSLRSYFKEAQIQLDSDVRENNLSHRFRHGFAMFHARFSENPLNVLELQKMMRHKSITSAMVYYNPTPEDELKTKTDFQNELYSLIPELKADGFHD